MIKQEDKLILIADDDKVVHESLGIYLKAEGYSYISAFDGLEALHLAKTTSLDLIILDLMMPEMSGIEVCREIRKFSDIPIIMLTAKGEEIDRILGLELGADDYIVKPFSPREVVVRVKTVLRRTANLLTPSKKLISLPGLEINLDNYQVKVNEQIVPFTPKEVEILYLLASHAGQVMEREKILENIWGYEYYGDSRTIDTHIKSIRKKIGTSENWSLVTVYGIGYRFEIYG